MLKLYAQAAIYRPPGETMLSFPSTQIFERYGLLQASNKQETTTKSDVPELPSIRLQKSVEIESKHFQAYNSLTTWGDSNQTQVHPNYIQTLSLPMQLEMMVTHPFPFKPFGLVHLANEITINELPRLNDSIDLSTRFGKVFFHRRGWVFEVISEAHQQSSQNSEPFVVASSYYLSRQDHDKMTKSQVSNIPKLCLPNWIAKTIEISIKNGASIVDSVEFKQDIGRQYARISGDYNPIHLSPYTARLLGFKKAIAHGMFSKALVLSKLIPEPHKLSHPVSIKTTFCQPIVLPMKTQLLFDKDQSHGDTTLKFALTSGQKIEKPRYHLVGSIE